VTKVKAHAERRTSRTEWTYEEEGNVAADETAAGRVDQEGVPPAELDIGAAIAYCMPLVWKTAAGEIILSSCVSARSTRYTQTRDLIRSQAQTPRPPRWGSTTSHMAAALWTGLECSWATAVRIMWDKHATGDNERKWGRHPTAYCTVCNALTSQRHTIVECQRPGAAQVRSNAVKKAWAEVDKLGVSLAGRTARIVLETLGHEDGYTVWTGMWTPAIRDELARRCPWQLRAREYRQVLKVCRHLVAGVLQLYRLSNPATQRKKRQREDVRELRQTRLEDYMRRLHTGEENLHNRNETRADGRTFDGRQYDG